jgi:hypothetical protein
VLGLPYKRQVPVLGFAPDGRNSFNIDGCESGSVLRTEEDCRHEDNIGQVFCEAFIVACRSVVDSETSWHVKRRKVPTNPILEAFMGVKRSLKHC